MNKFSSGYTTLYHISKHGPANPIPTPSHYKGNERVEGKDTALWMTPNYYEVMYNHGVMGKVHAYRIDNGLIDEAGGIYPYDDAMELIFTKEIWHRGIKEGKIKYLGSVKEKKVTRGKPDNIGKTAPKFPTGKYRFPTNESKTKQILQKKIYTCGYFEIGENKDYFEQKQIDLLKRVKNLNEDDIFELDKLEKDIDKFLLEVEIYVDGIKSKEEPFAKTFAKKEIENLRKIKDKTKIIKKKIEKLLPLSTQRENLVVKCNFIINEISESEYSKYRYEEIVSKYNSLKKEYMVVISNIP